MIQGSRNARNSSGSCEASPNRDRSKARIWHINTTPGSGCCGRDPVRVVTHPALSRKALVLMAKLDSEVAIAPGFGRGMSREIGLELASSGASVVISDMDGEPAKQALVAIELSGCQAASCIGGVTDADFADRFGFHCGRQLRRPDYRCQQRE